MKNKEGNVTDYFPPDDVRTHFFSFLLSIGLARLNRGNVGECQNFYWLFSVADRNPPPPICRQATDTRLAKWRQPGAIFRNVGQNIMHARREVAGRISKHISDGRSGLQLWNSTSEIKYCWLYNKNWDRSASHNSLLFSQHHAWRHNRRIFWHLRWRNKCIWLLNVWQHTSKGCGPFLQSIICLNWEMANEIVHLFLACLMLPGNIKYNEPG